MSQKELQATSCDPPGSVNNERKMRERLKNEGHRGIDRERARLEKQKVQIYRLKLFFQQSEGKHSEDLWERLRPNKKRNGERISDGMAE